MTYRQPFKGDYIITQAYDVTTGTDKNGHTGIDYGCPKGTEILASAAGTVMYAGWDATGYGNMVIICHNAKASTLYAHLQRITVKAGQPVKQSDPIGFSGWTGKVIPEGPGGAHLHFEARRIWNDHNSHFDPMTLPLISVDDSIGTGEDSPLQPGTGSAMTVPAGSGGQQPIGAGMVRIVCELPANVRNTYNPMIINGQKKKGETFEICAGTKLINGLPYHRIVPHHVDDLGGLVAEFDSYGTQILEQVTDG